MQEQKEKKFFISRTKHDCDIALFVRNALREIGADAVTEEDFSPGGSFIEGMHKYLQDEWRVIAILSKSYFESNYCNAEWQQPLAKDPLNLSGRLILLNIDCIEPPGVLKPLVYWDLSSTLEDENMLRDTILAATGFLNPDLLNVKILPRSIANATFLTNVPFANLSGLVGRDNEYQALVTALKISSEPQICCLIGLGGIGKTSLVRHYARCMADHYSVVWWVNSETEKELIRDLAALRQTISGVFSGETDEMSARIALDLASNCETDKPWLIVFDNIPPTEKSRTLVAWWHLPRHRHDALGSMA